MSAIRVFIGYDASEVAAFHTLSQSIIENTSIPTSITPINLNQLNGYYHRPPHHLASTEFSFSRFLVPFLADYQGWAIFTDCDMLCRSDLAELWDLRDEQYAVQVVKHEHKPVNKLKFNANIQTRYEKKNWSSVMLLNCGLCNALTLEYVNSATGLELHQFNWLSDEKLIGELPGSWNHLVGYDLYDQNANLVHFTEGGPYFSPYRDCDYAEEWFDVFNRTRSVIEAGNPSHVESLTPKHVTPITSPLPGPQ